MTNEKKAGVKKSNAITSVKAGVKGGVDVSCANATLGGGRKGGPYVDCGGRQGRGPAGVSREDSTGRSGRASGKEPWGRRRWPEWRDVNGVHAKP